MFRIIGSFVHSGFVAEYFKDMVLVLIVICYFVLLALSRPRIVKDVKPDPRSSL